MNLEDMEREEKQRVKKYCDNLPDNEAAYFYITGYKHAVSYETKRLKAKLSKRFY